jgi:TPR repeat protein
MMKFSRNFFLLTALLVSLHTRADLQTGVDAIVRRDYDTALNAFKPLAEKGNVAAQVNLGNLYMKGLGVEQNYHLAQHWYLKAAEQGERMAQTKLGILYYYGLGIAKDPAEAARWFQKAAESGETSAQSILGSLYSSGDGVAKNPAMAFYWYTMAEEQGNKEAAKGRKSLEEELTPGQRDEALRLMNETRKLRGEQEEKAFEAATAGLGTPPVPKADEVAADPGYKSATKAVKTKKKPTPKKSAGKKKPLP